MRFQHHEGLSLPSLLCLMLTFLLAIPTVFSQDDCGFLMGPSGLSVGCQDSCVWVVPDFERAAQTTAYAVDSIGYLPPLGLGTGDLREVEANYFTGNVSLPFGFSFFDSDFFALKISSRGFVTFNTGLTGQYNYPFQQLGGGQLPPNSIMAPYGAIGTSGGGEIRTETIGEAPCRRFVISWEYVPQDVCQDNEFLSQVVLYETSNVVEVHMGQFETCGPGACVGIQGSNGEGAYGPADYNTGAFAIENLAFRYAPTGETQTELVYLMDDEVIGQGDSLEVCLEESAELVIGANFPVILPPPPVAGSCDAIPEDACDTSLVYDFNLDAWETSTINFNFDGELLGVAVTSDWLGGFGSSWPSDMGLQLCDPSGTCGFIQDQFFNGNLTGTLLGYWPGYWDTSFPGFYETCLTVPTGLLQGDGNWLLTIENGWFSSQNNVNFNGTVTLFYACNLEPEEPDTSQFMATDTVMIEFALESQTADFVILDLDGNPLNALCSEDGPAVLSAEIEGGVWTADCVGCLDPAGEIDPALASPGLLEVTYTIEGDCGDLTEVEAVQVGLTPNVNTANVGALCPFSEPVQLIGTPGGGQWQADCGGCVTTDGLFDPSVGSGVFSAEYTFGTLCTATETVTVNVGEEVALGLEDLTYCESTGSIQLDDEGIAGMWTADCGGCIAQNGIFTPPGSGAFNVSFMPGAGCGVESSALIQVDQTLPIGSANIPDAFCVDASPLDLIADVPGGTWTASGSGLVGATFSPGSAPLGTSVLSYTVENGSCTNSASFATAVLPPLSAVLQEEDPFCVSNSGGPLNADFDLDAEAIWINVPNVEWAADCGGCINANGVFDPGVAGVGTHTVTVSYDESLGCSTSGSVDIVVAPSVNATIDAIPDLCESGSTEAFSAADNGGTWTADCGGCITPAGTFDPGIGAGNYTITHTINDVCTDVDAVLITVVPQRDATILVDVPNDELCIAVDEWQMGSIWAGGVWSATSQTGVNSIGVESGLLDLQAAGIGTVTVSHVLEGLCGDSDSHVLDILACSVELVNIFTPNGDGKNDRLIFKYIELYPDNHLTVYNRNGAVVYEAEGYDNGWDGDGAADGTHYFVLQLPEGVEHAGHLMIQR